MVFKFTEVFYLFGKGNESISEFSSLRLFKISGKILPSGGFQTDLRGEWRFKMNFTVSGMKFKLNLSR